MDYTWITYYMDYIWIINGLHNILPFYPNDCHTGYDLLDERPRGKLSLSMAAPYTMSVCIGRYACMYTAVRYIYIYTVYIYIQYIYIYSLSIWLDMYVYILIIITLCHIVIVYSHIISATQISQVRMVWSTIRAPTMGRFPWARLRNPSRQFR